jgi:4-diphosphocytidyl-2-C-methyl-D-erythritol kinase
MELFPPAKINLSFRIKFRREDGFHEIESLMAPITVRDRLVIERISDTGAVDFCIDDSSLPTGNDNLVVKAANLFRTRTRISGGVRIRLEKRIPYGAGLGGGSSDAASTLVGLNQLFETDLSRAELINIGAEIGSDVPFFIVNSISVCRGRGERVEPADLPRRFRLLLLKPEFAVPTPWAYSKWKDSREMPGVAYVEQEFEGTRFVNDLERPVFQKYVLLGQLKTWLLQQPEVGVALLSGSGSTVFVVVRDGAEPDELARRVRGSIDQEMWSQVCETI